MRATVRMTPGGTGDQTQATYQVLDYLFQPVKNNPTCADRVAWIGGNLSGYGVIERKASLMATALDYGHEHLPGRRYRHVVVSCEPCEEEIRGDAERRLRETAPLLAVLLGVWRWLAVIHRDTTKPHMHLIVANFDEEKGRRFDFRPDFLKELQEMNWTPFLEKGKGLATGKKGPRGQAIERLRLLRGKECPRQRVDALKNLQEFLAKTKATGRTTDAIVGVLTNNEMPPGWDGKKLLTKSGKPRATPSLVIQGIEIRLAFYLRWARGRARSESRKKDRPRTKDKPRRIDVSMDGPEL